MTATYPASDAAEAEPAPPAPPTPVGALARSRWLRVALVGLALAAYGAFLLALWMGDPHQQWIYDSPQDHVRSVLAQQWADTGQPTYDLALYDELPADIAPALTPRDASLDVATGTVIPKDFANSVALYTAVTAMHSRLLQMIVPVGTILFLLSTGYLAWRLTGRFAAAVLAAAFVAVMPSLWAVTYNGSSPHGFTMAAAVFGIALLVPPLGQGVAAIDRPWRHVTAGVLIGIAIGFHSGWAFAHGAAASALIISSTPTVRSVARRIALCGAGVALALAPTAIYNWWLYGSPLETGYSRFDDLIEATNPDSGLRTFAVSWSGLGNNVGRYWLRPEAVVLFAAGVAGFVLVVRQRRARVHPITWVLIAFGLVAHVMLTGARYVYGTTAYRGNSSFNRYSLPLVTMACVLAAVCVCALMQRAHLRRALAGGLIAALVIIGSAATIYRVPAGLASGRGLIEARQRDRAAILATVPEGGVIITSRWDKYLWPQRSTLISSYLITDPSESIDPSEQYLIEQVPTPERIAEVSATLLDRQIPVFILRDGSWFSMRWAEWLDWTLYHQHGGLCRRDTEVPWMFEITSECAGPPAEPAAPRERVMADP